MCREFLKGNSTVKPNLYCFSAVLKAYTNSGQDTAAQEAEEFVGDSGHITAIICATIESTSVGKSSFNSSSHQMKEVNMTSEEASSER